MENGVDDAVHAFDVDEADHGPSAATHFHEAALDHIGGAQFAPQVPGEGEERQQFRQVVPQPLHHPRVEALPAGAEAAECGFGLSAALGQIDGLGSGFDFVVIALASLLQNVAHLVHPARRTEKATRYLFSGLLRCGRCGSNIIIVQGDEKRRHAKYGCPRHRYHVDCNNSIAIRRDRLEQQLIEALATQVLQPQALEYALKRFQEETEDRLDEQASRTSAKQKTQLRNELARLRRHAENLAEAIAEFGKSPTLLGQLANTESRIRAIEPQLARLEHFERPSIGIDELREFLLKKAGDLQSVLQGDPLLGREILAKHIRELVLTPRQTPDGPVFDVTGDIDLFGGDLRVVSDPRHR